MGVIVDGRATSCTASLDSATRRVFDYLEQINRCIDSQSLHQARHREFGQPHTQMPIAVVTVMDAR